MARSRLVLAYLIAPLVAAPVFMCVALTFVSILAPRAGYSWYGIERLVTFFVYAFPAGYAAILLVVGPLLLAMARSGLTSAWAAVGLGALLPATPFLVYEGIRLAFPASHVHRLVLQDLAWPAILVSCGIATALMFWLIAAPVLRDSAAVTPRSC